jgi:hypothetical protein
VAQGRGRNASHRRRQGKKTGVLRLRSSGRDGPNPSAQDDRAGGLAFCILGEHFFGVDGDEDAAAAGEDFVFFVEDLGGVDVLTAVDADFPALDAQRLMQRDGKYSTVISLVRATTW